MSNLSAYDLLKAMRSDRSTWLSTKSLPSQFNRPPFEIHCAQSIPYNVKDTIEFAADHENPGCGVRDVVGAVLESYGADVQSQLSDQIGGRWVNCDAMAGSIDDILRVIFLSSHYADGDRRSPGTQTAAPPQ